MRASLLGVAILTLAACSGDASDDALQAGEAEAADIEARAVRVGLSGPEMDACAGFGVINGAPEEGQQIHTAPSADAEEVARLSDGADVVICEISGGWIGIVFADEGGDTSTCETGSPVDAEQDYAGPCPSGWIRDGAVEFVAG